MVNSILKSCITRNGNKDKKYDTFVTPKNVENIFPTYTYVLTPLRRGLVSTPVSLDDFKELSTGIFLLFYFYWNIF